MTESPTWGKAGLNEGRGVPGSGRTWHPRTHEAALEADPQRELDLAGGIYRACTFAKSPA